MSKITNDDLTRPGTGCFIAVPTWQQWASKGWNTWLVSVSISQTQNRDVPRYNSHMQRTTSAYNQPMSFRPRRLPTLLIGDWPSRPERRHIDAEYPAQQRPRDVVKTPSTRATGQVCQR